MPSRLLLGLVSNAGQDAVLSSRGSVVNLRFYRFAMMMRGLPWRVREEAPRPR